MKSAPAVGFRYRASRLLIVAMLVVALLAILAVWISAAPTWLHVVLTACVIGAVTLGARGLLRPPVMSVLWRLDGGVELLLDNGADGSREVQGAVAAARVVGPLVSLTLRWPPREHTTLWLLPDNLDADTRRKLCMRVGAAASGAVVSGNADSL